MCFNEVKLLNYILKNYKMKKLPLFICLFVSFCFIGCQKDIIGEQEDPIEIVTPPVEIKLGDISGIIFDQNNNPIEGATIIHNRDEVYATDENGYFKIDDTAGPADGALLKISKDGYFNNYKFVFIETQKTAHIRIQLIAKEAGQNTDGINGGTIDIEGGAKISFPERAFVDENNVSYEGRVTVYTHWYNPSDPSLASSMPGDLRGLSNAGKIQQLSTFGMMAVELYTEDGRELNLAQGINATLTFPIPDDLSTSAESEIITWSLNEQTAFWEEESVAIRDGDTYVAEVSHFSFWNCDVPYDLIFLKGRLIGEDDIPLPWYKVCISVVNSGVTRNGYSNSNGEFSGAVPNDELLVLKVKDECQGVIYEQQIGPFSSNADIGDLIINNNSQTTISGSLRCNGMPVESGYAKISLPNGVLYIADVDVDGNYSITVQGCTFTEITIQGIDIENNRVSGIVTQSLEPNQGNVEIVPFEVCQDLEEFIRYKIGDSNEEILTEPVGSIIDGNLVLRALNLSQLNVSTIEIEVEGAQNGSANVLEINAHIVENGLNFNSLCGPDSFIDCEGFTFTITSIGGVGTYAEGTFMGEGTDQNGEATSLMGSFKVNIDASINTNGISGVVWADENEDGIRQINELPLEDVEVVLYDELQNQTSQFTDEEGRYAFEKIYNTSIDLGILLESGFQLSIANQGGDDSIDCDFESNPISIDFTDGEIIENFDAGIHTTGQIVCSTPIIDFPDCPGNDPFADVTITVDRGTAPFEIFIDGNLFTTSDTSEIILRDVPIGDYYEYTIIDDLGSECSGEFSLEFIDAFGCIIEANNAVNGENNGSAAVIGLSDLIDSAIWSNGETTLEIDGLEPGEYSVTVTSVNGCTSECEIEISEDNFECTVLGPTAICQGGSPFEILVEANFEILDYSWSTGEVGDFIVINPTEETVYSVTVSNGPSMATCDITIQVNPSISCAPSSTPATCGSNNGTASVEATGSSGNYTYVWSNGAASQTITGLEPGFYSVTVTDFNGCATSCTSIVEDIQTLECEVIPGGGLCGSSSGTATVEVFNGSGDYSYAWNNGSILQEITNLGANDYSVTVTDNLTGCTTTCSNFVETAIDLEVTVVQNQFCNDNNYLTELTVLATGGAGDYTYEWSFGSTDQETEIDILGTYSVTVTDILGCTSETEFEIVPSSSQIGDLVWIELGGEPNAYDEGIDGFAELVSVVLYDAEDPLNLIAIDSTTTGQEGQYLFDQLQTGQYVVGILGDFDMVEKDMGEENLDSDFDHDSQLTDLIIIDGCNSTYDIDAGIY